MPQPEGFVMPQLVGSTVRGVTPVNLLTGWQYEYLLWPARIKCLIRAVGTVNRLTVFSGSETIQEESPVQGGGTLGTTPAELNTPPIVWDAPAGDRLKLNVRTTVGADSVDWIIYAYPLR